MFRFVASIMCLLTAALPAGAFACTIAVPPIEKQAEEVAHDGVLIQGTLIQALDAARQRPEIIRADTIFIGEGEPRDFVIYRSPFDFRWALHPSGSWTEKRDGKIFVYVSPCGGPPQPDKVGTRYDRLVLVPAKVIDDAASNGRWLFYEYGSVDSGKGLDLLLELADRLGRLRSRPPTDPDARGR